MISIDFLARHIAVLGASFALGLLALAAGYGLFAFAHRGRGREEERWDCLDLCAGVMVCAVGIVTVAGSILAAAGLFSSWSLALCLLTVVAVCFDRLPLSRLRPSVARPRLFHAMLAALIVAALAFCLRHPIADVIGGLDRSVHLASGVELARTSDPGWTEPARFSLSDVGGSGEFVRFPGFRARPALDGNTVEVRPHALPGMQVWYALAFRGGGLAATQWAGPVLMAVALLAVGAFVRLQAGGAAALTAVLLLGFLPAQLWFARAAGEQMLVQALLWGSLYLYVRPRRAGAGAPGQAPAAAAVVVLVALCMTTPLGWVLLPVLALHLGLRRIGAGKGQGGGWSIWVPGAAAGLSLAVLQFASPWWVEERLAPWALRLDASPVLLGLLLAGGVATSGSAGVAVGAAVRGRQGKKWSWIERIVLSVWPLVVTLAGVALLILLVGNAGSAEKLRRAIPVFLPALVAAGACFAGMLWRRKGRFRLAAGLAVVVLVALLQLIGRVPLPWSHTSDLVGRIGSVGVRFQPGDVVLCGSAGLAQRWGGYLRGAYGVEVHGPAGDESKWAAWAGVMPSVIAEGGRVLYFFESGGWRPPALRSGVATLVVGGVSLSDPVWEELWEQPASAARTESAKAFVVELHPEKLPSRWHPESPDAVAQLPRRSLPAELVMDEAAAPYLQNFFDTASPAPGIHFRWTNGFGRVFIGDLLRFPLPENKARLKITARLSSGRPALGRPLDVHWALDYRLLDREREIGVTPVGHEWTDVTVEVDRSLLRPDSFLEFTSLRPEVPGALPNRTVGCLVQFLRIE